MRIHVPTAIRRLRRALGCLALLVAVLLAGALSAGAAARPARGHRSSCSAARHAKHGAAKRCARKHARKSHGNARRAKKPARKPPAAAVPLTPAGCEDGGPPTRSAEGSYSCQDGSEPACEDGSTPVRPSAGSAPMCRPPRDEGSSECGLDAKGECQLELACEDAEEAVQAPQGCEHGSAFEEAELEA